MKDKMPRFSLRLDKTILKKISYIASYEGRTTNKEIEHLISEHIKDFEKKDGKIILENFCNKNNNLNSISNSIFKEK